MAEFTVRTCERIEGTYRVQAATREEALAHFDDGPPIDWTGVEQVSYLCFEVQSAETTDA